MNREHRNFENTNETVKPGGNSKPFTKSVLCKEEWKEEAERGY